MFLTVVVAVSVAAGCPREAWRGAGRGVGVAVREGVHDWLTTTRNLLIGDGASPEQATAIATFIVGAFRGLMLDLLQTGERERVDAGFEVLATMINNLATAASEREPRPRKRTSSAKPSPRKRAS